MVSAVSKKATSGFCVFRVPNIFDPHPLGTKFHSRGLLNTSCYLSPFQPGRTLNHLLLFRILFQQSIQKDFKSHSIFRITTNPRGLNGFFCLLPAIVSIRNLSSCLCVASRDNILWGGGSQHMWLLVSHPNLIIVNPRNTFCPSPASCGQSPWIFKRTLYAYI